MANRPKEYRTDQQDAPNMKMIKPAEGGIHATVGTGVAQTQGRQQPQGNQAGQNPRT